jgi:uncharacterized membrane protein
MATQTIYPLTRQGVRDLDHPMQVKRRENVGRHERAASVVLGGLLAGFGLGKGGVAGLLTAAASMGLICRGLSGHCAVYEAAGLDTAR